MIGRGVIAPSSRVRFHPTDFDAGLGQRPPEARGTGRRICGIAVEALLNAVKPGVRASPRRVRRKS